MVLEKTLESPLNWKKIKPVNPKGNQSWIFIWRTDAETEAPKLWPPNGKNRLIGKDPDDGKDWRQEEKGNDRGWDGWMASLTQWTWVWVGSRSWWRTEKPVVLQSLGLQKVRQDWATELNWTELEHSLALPLGVEWKLTFSSPVATAEFSRFAGVLSVALSQHHLLGFEIAQLEFHHLY